MVSIEVDVDDLEELPMEAEVMELKLDLLKVVATTARQFNAPALCPPVAAAASTHPTEQEETDTFIEDYMSNIRAANGSTTATAPLGDVGLSHQFTEDMEMVWDKEFSFTWEEECKVGGVRDDHKVDTVEATPVVTRGTPPINFTCNCCGVRSAHDLQVPSEVLNVAYTMEGEEGALDNLHAMAQLLVDGQFDAVIERTSVCRRVRCMIAQNKLTCGDYEAWYFSGKMDADGFRGAPRKQLMLGTDRMNQSILLNENVLLLRWLYIIKDRDGKPTFSKEHITALFRWFVHNSQFVQEREKRFIATAMCIVESATFPFTFQPAQSFVDQMSSIPRNYLETQILAHILDDTFDPARWISWAHRLMETAFPKAADAAYMLMCIFHWRAEGEPRDDAGKPILRIRHNAKCKTLFTVEGFQQALERATQLTKASSPSKGKTSKSGDQPNKPKRKAKSIKLYYASAPLAHSNVTMSKGQTREDTRQLIKSLTGGSTRRGYTVAHGVQGEKCAPTCGSVQNDSGVHTAQRYDGVAVGLHLEGKEKADMLHLVVKVLPMGNSEGKEKLGGKTADKTKSKACAVLRKPTEYTPQVTMPVTHTRRSKIAQSLTTQWEVRPKRD